MEGLTVVDNGSTLATHLTEVLLDHAHEILGRQEFHSLMNDLKSRGQTAVVDELVPGLLGPGAVHRVLQNLLAERVSIRNLTTIFEALAEAAPSTKDPDILTEYVRAGLARQISHQYRDADGVLWCATLAPELERRLQEAMVRGERGTRLLPSPGLSDDLVRSVNGRLTSANGGDRPVLLCTAAVRPYLKRYLERFLPRLVVLSHNEITPETRVKSIGVIDGTVAPSAGAAFAGTASR
jgi:flagellar biosynthesis protein FlhA